MANRSDDNGGPVGLLSAAVTEWLRNRFVLSLVMILTGTTAGTKIGAPDRFTGTDWVNGRAQLEQKIESMSASCSWRIQQLEDEVDELKTEQKEHNREAGEWKRRIDRNSACCGFLKER